VLGRRRGRDDGFRRTCEGLKLTTVDGLQELPRFRRTCEGLKPDRRHGAAAGPHRFRRTCEGLKPLAIWLNTHETSSFRRTCEGLKPFGVQALDKTARVSDGPVRD